MSVTVRAIGWALVLAGVAGTAAAADPAPPLRYYIGDERVVVGVTATTKTTRQIETVTGPALANCTARHAADPDLCVTSREVTTREGNVGTRLAPDAKLHAAISAASRAMTDDQMSIELRDGMLLKSINLRSTGRAGDIIGSIAKFAGFLIGAPGLLAQAGPAPAPVPTSTCDAFKKPFSDLPDTARLMIWQGQEQCDRWQEIVKLQKARAALVDDRLQLEQQIRGATFAELKLLLEKVKAATAAADKADEDLKKRQASFTAALDAFTAGLKLGVVAVTQQHDQVLKLTELPTSDGITSGMTESAVGQLPLTPEVKTLWTLARVVITLDLADAVACPGPSEIPNDGISNDNSIVQIFFRQGTPARLRVFIADQTADPGRSTLRSIADRFDNFVHPCLPVSSMAFKRSVWADRELSLTFDDKGRPVKLERTSKSDAAAIAASFAAAASSFRDEVATTVAKVVDVQSNRRKIDMDGLTSRLEKAKAEKEILDQTFALDSAGANFDAALKQSQATSALHQLEAEVALSTAQASVDHKQQIDALKLQLDQLKQQLDILKTQQELDKLKK